LSQYFLHSAVGARTCPFFLKQPIKMGIAIFPLDVPEYSVIVDD